MGLNINSDSNNLVVSNFKDSISSFFMASKTQVELLEHKINDGISEKIHGWLSVVGGAGEHFQVSLLVLLTSSLATSSHPKLTVDPSAVIDPNEAEDWCGEISNQILGRFKNLMLTTAGVDFTIGVPLTKRSDFSGVERAFDLKLHKDAKTIDLRVSSTSGAAVFILQYYSDKDFDAVSQMRLDSNSGLQEGDALLF